MSTYASWSFDVPEIDLDAGIIRVLEREQESTLSIKACALPFVIDALDEGVYPWVFMFMFQYKTCHTVHTMFHLFIESIKQNSYK